MLRTQALVTAFSLILCSAESVRAQSLPATTYRVHQVVTVDSFPSSAKKVACWVSIPSDDPYQRVLDMTVSVPQGEWRIMGEPGRGNRFLYVEALDPGTTSLAISVDFVLRRWPVAPVLEAHRVGRLSPRDLALYSDELRLDAPHMVVTPTIRQMARETCGDETNALRKVHLLLGRVAALADHYSKDPTKPKCGVGDSNDCIVNGGGCCTDLHSLFISLARAEGVPARLQMGYRLLAKNAGKEFDPGYRCWVEYFVPGYGWVPADIVEADATGGLGPQVWFNGLTVERLWLNEGREFVLPLAANRSPVNHMSLGHAEVDGQPIRVLPEGDLPSQISRKITFEILGPDAFNDPVSRDKGSVRDSAVSQELG